MEYSQDQLTSFRRSVRMETEQKIKDIQQQIKEYEAAELEKAKERQQEELFYYMQSQVKLIRARHRQAVTKAELESRRALIEFRNSLSEQVFEKAEEKLLDFTSTKQYPDYLKKRLQEAAVGFPDEKAVLLVKADDVTKAKRLLPVLPAGSEVRTHNGIKIGGFILLYGARNILIDETLENKLRESRPGFYRECGLKVE